MKYKVKTLPAWFKWLSDKIFTNNLLEIVTPWGIYIVNDLPEEDLKYILPHATQHCEQIEELGIFKFYLAYVWEWIKVGYFCNKFEIEARAAEGRDDYHKQLEPFYKSTKRSWSKYFE